MIGPWLKGRRVGQRRRVERIDILAIILSEVTAIAGSSVKPRDIRIMAKLRGITTSIKANRGLEGGVV
jgi:hypothetical protein